MFGFIVILFVHLCFGALIFSIFLNFLGLIFSFSLSYYLWAIPDGNPTTTGPIYPTNPKSWWPTGVPQGEAPIGSALLTFITLGNSFSPD